VLGGLLGGEPAGAQQRRAGGMLVVPLAEDRGQQVPWPKGGVLALACQGACGPQGLACLLAEIAAIHGASSDRWAHGAGLACPTPVGRLVGHGEQPS
jgi:hypothetical protein